MCYDQTSRPVELSSSWATFHISISYVEEQFIRPAEENAV